MSWLRKTVQSKLALGHKYFFYELGLICKLSFENKEDHNSERNVTCTFYN